MDVIDLYKNNNKNSSFSRQCVLLIDIQLFLSSKHIYPNAPNYTTSSLSVVVARFLCLLDIFFDASDCGWEFSHQPPPILRYKSKCPRSINYENYQNFLKASEEFLRDYIRNPNINSKFSSHSKLDFSWSQNVISNLTQALTDYNWPNIYNPLLSPHSNTKKKSLKKRGVSSSHGHFLVLISSFSHFLESLYSSHSAAFIDSPFLEKKDLKTLFDNTIMEYKSKSIQILWATPPFVKLSLSGKTLNIEKEIAIVNLDRVLSSNFFSKPPPNIFGNSSDKATNEYCRSLDSEMYLKHDIFDGFEAPFLPLLNNDESDFLQCPKPLSQDLLIEQINSHLNDLEEKIKSSTNALMELDTPMNDILQSVQLEMEMKDAKIKNFSLKDFFDELYQMGEDHNLSHLFVDVLWMTSIHCEQLIKFIETDWKEREDFLSNLTLANLNEWSLGDPSFDVYEKPYILIYLQKCENEDESIDSMKQNRYDMETLMIKEIKMRILALLAIKHRRIQKDYYCFIENLSDRLNLFFAIHNLPQDCEFSSGLSRFIDSSCREYATLLNDFLIQTDIFYSDEPLSGSRKRRLCRRLFRSPQKIKTQDTCPDGSFRHSLTTESDISINSKYQSQPTPRSLSQSSMLKKYPSSSRKELEITVHSASQPCSSNKKKRKSNIPKQSSTTMERLVIVRSKLDVHYARESQESYVRSITPPFSTKKNQRVLVQDTPTKQKNASISTINVLSVTPDRGNSSSSEEELYIAETPKKLLRSCRTLSFST